MRYMDGKGYLKPTGFGGIPNPLERRDRICIYIDICHVTGMRMHTGIL